MATISASDLMPAGLVAEQLPRNEKRRAGGKAHER
jgi:hypothetical protein